MFRNIFLLILYLGITCFSFAQTLKTVDSIENECQVCLDKGVFMLGCSINYYYQMDSLLNKIYNQLRTNRDSTQKEVLKKEEKEWLTRRNKYFKKLETNLSKAINEHGPVQDDEMFMYEDKARFVRNRILQLLKEGR